MRKKKQRAALNYPQIKPTGFYPTPTVAEIKGLFPPQVRAQGAYHLCVVEFSTKKRYHLLSDFLFGEDKTYKANLCNSITEVRRLAEATPELSASVAGFLGDHLQPKTCLTASVAQLLK
jgi:hypothetical protein